MRFPDDVYAKAFHHEDATPPAPESAVEGFNPSREQEVKELETAVPPTEPEPEEPEEPELPQEESETLVD